ncbi:hypothetical protein Q4F19_16785 [Sphingomonas sp. BIUV-7]|uniref:Uncharacterized protein n=1 Tax=Sphingomonas natans TaxID=3063330 RepID=A0ABT8YCK2_9SPHN|nr:hypothetical protein [Sphingomonas sp. BIUV-7]MDO6416048.1 hypothetical protein [Sphingomonas sp. BIUV-7]
MPGTLQNFVIVQRRRIDREIAIEKLKARPDEQRMERLREFQRAVALDLVFQRSARPETSAPAAGARSADPPVCDAPTAQEPDPVRERCQAA